MRAVVRVPPFLWLWICNVHRSIFVFWVLQMGRTPMQRLLTVSFICCPLFFSLFSFAKLLYCDGALTIFLLLRRTDVLPALPGVSLDLIIFMLIFILNFFPLVAFFSFVHFIVLTVSLHSFTYYCSDRSTLFWICLWTSCARFSFAIRINTDSFMDICALSASALLFSLHKWK